MPPISVKVHEEPSASQNFLNSSQYTSNGILRYEVVFGKGFISTGGKVTTEELCALLNLRSSDSVLDVGCGIGGSAFFMAQTFGCSVHGIDLSTNMLGLAIENLKDHPKDCKVTFEVANALEVDIPENTYSVIYCRDCIIHIKEKDKLFKNFYRWLKPGGQLLITDYCRGDKSHSKEFIEYMKDRQYHLLPVKDYGNILSSVGFKDVQAIDNTKRFREILQKELEEFKPKKDSFVKVFSLADYDDLIAGWNQKLVRTSEGDQVWGLFKAKK